MIWNMARECMSRDALMMLQGERLVALVKRVYYSVEYYRRKMQKEGIEPGDIRGIEDLNKLPFTTKEDLRQNAPYDFLAVPPSEIVRYHSSNATTDTKIIVGCTRNDIEIWTECVARCIHMAGFSKNDTIQIAHDYGFFMDGLGVHRGAEKVGTAVVLSPMSNIEDHIKMMKALNVTGIMCTPSYLLRIGRMIEKMDVSKELKLRTAICGTEPWSVRMRKETERMLKIDTYDIYGLSELAGLGMACDCEHHKGLHIQEDYFVPEVLCKDTNTAVKDGENGELVFTTLQREGTPLIRYRTGDLITITHERCECGRTSARITRLSDKENDMFVIRGVSIFQFQIEDMFAEINDINARYLMRIYIEANLDMIDVIIEPDASDGIYPAKKEETVKIRVAKAVRNIIGVMPKVYLVGTGAIQHTVGRISTVVDDRRRTKRLSYVEDL